MILESSHLASDAFVGGRRSIWVSFGAYIGVAEIGKHLLANAQ